MLSQLRQTCFSICIIVFFFYLIFKRYEISATLPKSLKYVTSSGHQKWLLQARTLGCFQSNHEIMKSQPISRREQARAITTTPNLLLNDVPRFCFVFFSYSICKRYEISPTLPESLKCVSSNGHARERMCHSV